MSKLEYRIIENPNYTSRSKIGIEVFPKNEPLMFLLSGLKEEKFPQYISELLENINFGVENTSFIFYEQMDWEDKADFLKYSGREIESDEIRIYLYDGKPNFSAIKKTDFFEIFYDYSSKLLEVYKDDKNLPNNWSISMEIELNRLKKAIEPRSSKSLSFVKKILLSQDTFPVTYYDDEVPFSFYCNDNGIKQDVTLSLKVSTPLFVLIDSKQTTYEDLSKIGIDKINNLTDINKKNEYRYIMNFSDNCQKQFLIIFGFNEYRDYYSCRIFGIIEIESN